ncbi:MAG: hypothetical protein JOY64_09760 [Alphaproteobacteria bacterium]|nr:hypothetical protein [Alphaproteobacteria bacterium]MBV8407905.1 hypothetical protein [Alphaproteobacteria bacterium]
MNAALNPVAYRQAKNLIARGKFVYDEPEAWSEHHPTTRMENEFVEAHGFAAYGNWFLGTNSAYQEGTTRHHELPYGDFESVHRCALLAAKRRAAEQKTVEIEQAIARLLALMEVKSAELA